MTAFAIAKMHFFPSTQGLLSQPVSGSQFGKRYSGYFLSWSVVLPSRMQFLNAHGERAQCEPILWCFAPSAGVASWFFSTGFEHFPGLYQPRCSAKSSPTWQFSFRKMLVSLQGTNNGGPSNCYSEYSWIFMNILETKIFRYIQKQGAQRSDTHFTQKNEIADRSDPRMELVPLSSFP
jgi:hypothetical protein